jgi:retinol dehydrogenase 12
MLYPQVFGAYTELYSGLSPDLTIEKDQGGYIIPWGRRGGYRPDLLIEVNKEDGNAAKLYDWCDRVTRQYT